MRIQNNIISDYTDHSKLKLLTLELYFFPTVLFCAALVQLRASLFFLAIVSAAFNFFSCMCCAAIAGRERTIETLYLMMKRRDNYVFTPLTEEDLKGLSFDDIIQRERISPQRIVSSTPHVFRISSVSGLIPCQIKCFGIFGGHSYIFLRDIPKSSDIIEKFKIFDEYGHLTNMGTMNAGYFAMAGFFNMYAAILIVAASLSYGIPEMVLLIGYAAYYITMRTGHLVAIDRAAREIHADSFALAQFDKADDIRHIFNVFSNVWNMQAAYLRISPKDLMTKVEHAKRLHYMLEAEQAVRGGGRWGEVTLLPRWTILNIVNAFVFFVVFVHIGMIGSLIWFVAITCLLIAIIAGVWIAYTSVNSLSAMPSVVRSLIYENDSVKRESDKKIIEALYQMVCGSSMRERFDGLRRVRQLGEKQVGHLRNARGSTICQVRKAIAE